jgi:hypothetical protein
MAITLFIVLYLLSLAHGQPDCSRIPIGNNQFYDISAVVGREFVLSDSFSFYKFTICTNTYADCGRCGGPAGYCQYTESWNDCLGKFSLAAPTTDKAGVDLLYDDGDWGNVGRVKIFCDPNVEDITEPVANPNPKSVLLYSKHACPVGPAPPISDCEAIPDPTGVAIYNLSPLINHQLFWSQASTNNYFKASICVSSFLDCKSCESGAGMCQYNSQSNDCVGKFSQAYGLTGQEGVDLIYDQGGQTQGRIRILCDPSVSLSPPSYDSNPIQITLRSKYACKCSWV